jgi:hypothetical protein
MKDNLVRRMFEQQEVVKDYVPSLDDVMRDPEVLKKYQEGPQQTAQETGGPQETGEPSPPAGAQGSSGPQEGQEVTDTVLGAQAGSQGQGSGQAPAETGGPQETGAPAETGQGPEETGAPAQQ